MSIKLYLKFLLILRSLSTFRLVDKSLKNNVVAYSHIDNFN